MTLEITVSKQDIMKAVIDEAYGEWVEVAKEEIDDNYGDAMKSMERCETTGRLEGLQEAYFIFFNESYYSSNDFDPDAYNEEVNG
jgi:hypothetical protein